jgi:hypothetical protein
LDGFVGDGGDFFVEQELRLAFVRGEVQVGEEDLIFAEEGVFAVDGFLYLDDYAAFVEQCGFVRVDYRPGGGVIVVSYAAAQARAGFHDNLVAGLNDFEYAVGHHGDAVFVVLDFFGDAYCHWLQVPSIMN